ncbi:hypothetical protein QBC36DRAFT_380624 [Triangularia setosa]|uniref:Uncharacterized protein n=1 Tax=Triangularia setosa TaxID=2587417 RepID=A0AAN7A5F3_9PEZI|nr:hypothetical protein QBC36DRAFT_380624 [Podospora setosa]
MAILGRSSLQISLITIITALVSAATLAECDPASVTAAPSHDTSLNPTANEHLGLAKRFNQCGDSTFENCGSNGSSWILNVRECATISPAWVHGRIAASSCIGLLLAMEVGKIPLLLAMEGE